MAFFFWGLAVAVVLAVWQVVVLGSDVSFSANNDENQNIILNKKQKYPKRL